MTTEELHKVLDNDNAKINVAELKQMLYGMKYDCLDKVYNAETKMAESYYIGEQNAFQICLDLLEHIKE